MDSLAAMEMRNRIRSELGVDIPAIEFFDRPNINRLHALVSGSINRDTSQKPESGEPRPKDATEPVEVGVLSDEQVDSMLLELLAAQGERS